MPGDDVLLPKLRALLAELEKVIAGAGAGGLLSHDALAELGGSLLGLAARVALLDRFTLSAFHGLARAAYIEAERARATDRRKPN